MTMFLHGGCKGIHCLGDAGYLSTYRPICWGGEKVPTFDPPKLGDRPPTGEIIDPLYQSLLLLQLPSLRTQPLWPLLRIFDDTPAVGCKDWRCQLLNWLSRHAVYRGCEEWITLEKRPLEGNKGLGRLSDKFRFSSMSERGGCANTPVPQSRWPLAATSIDGLSLQLVGYKNCWRVF